MPSAPDTTYRTRRAVEMRSHMRKTIVWTVVAIVLFGSGFAIVAAESGVVVMVAGTAALVLIIIACAAYLAWQAAGTRASSTMISEWAAANGWAYWGRDAPDCPAPEPFESRFDDYMLAHETFPEATPLLRKGTRRYVTDVLAGTVDGTAVRIANHCYETETYDSDGTPITSYTHHVVALMAQQPKVTPLRLVRRSRLGKALKGADDHVAGIGRMKAVDLENRSFNSAFSVRVADDADMVLVYEMFDPVLQERLGNGTVVPEIDLVEVEGAWLMVADGGTVTGGDLERIEVMVAAAQWAITTFR
ncbi:MAG: hypothetical protein WCI83_03235 [Thermoleophilia bacterium]